MNNLRLQFKVELKKEIMNSNFRCDEHQTLSAIIATCHTQ